MALSVVSRIMTRHKNMNFSMKDFFSRCDKKSKKLWIWSHLLKKPLTENFVSCAVSQTWLPY